MSIFSSRKHLQLPIAAPIAIFPAEPNSFPERSSFCRVCLSVVMAAASKIASAVPRPLFLTLQFAQLMLFSFPLICSFVASHRASC